ncbi:MAG TPA: hypothetical protein O0X69_01250, partial [Methanocorpusculum sp.]|nr:hypothetical protein [Methanocorpusculum sp.]
FIYDEHTKPKISPILPYFIFVSKKYHTKTYQKSSSRGQNGIETPICEWKISNFASKIFNFSHPYFVIKLLANFTFCETLKYPQEKQYVSRLSASLLSNLSAPVHREEVRI